MIPILLGLVMLTMGMTLKAGDFLPLIKRPLLRSRRRYVFAVTMPRAGAPRGTGVAA